MRPTLVRLNFRIVGTGAVGLATGYLLARQGHRVVHQSIRGGAIAQLRVHSQIDGVHQPPTAYRPHYLSVETRSSGASAADYVIFAAAPRRIATFLEGLSDQEWLNGPEHLVLASVVDPDWRDMFNRTPAFRPRLAFPIMSCEYATNHVLTLVTDMRMDILEQPSAADNGPFLSEFWAHSGFQLGEAVSLARFAARYLLTAAVYANLLAIHRGNLAKVDISGKLLQATLEGLVVRFRRCHPWQGLDFPAAGHGSLVASAELIRTAFDRRNLLQENICTLLSEGASKLEAHLRPLDRMTVHNARSLLLDDSRSLNTALGKT